MEARQATYPRFHGDPVGASVLFATSDEGTLELDGAEAELAEPDHDPPDLSFHLGNLSWGQALGPAQSYFRNGRAPGGRHLPAFVG